MAVAIDGKFYVVGDDGLYEVVFGAGDYTLVQKADESARAGFELSGLAADPNNPDLLYAVGVDGGVVPLFTIVPSTGVGAQLAEIVGFAHADRGPSFAAARTLWTLNKAQGAANCG